MVGPNEIDRENVELQRKMLEETQRLRQALEKQSVERQGQPKPIASKPIENRNKVGENKAGIPTPMPVVLTDENGSNRKVFNKLIEEIVNDRDTMSEIARVQAQQDLDFYSAVKRVNRFDVEYKKRKDDRDRSLEKIQKERTEIQKRISEDAEKDRKKSLEVQEKQYYEGRKSRSESLLEKILKARQAGSGIISSVIKGTFGKVTADISTTLRKSSLLQVALTNKNRAFGDLAEDLSITAKREQENKEYEERSLEIEKKEKARLFERQSELVDEEKESNLIFREAATGLLQLKNRFGQLGNISSNTGLDTFTEDEEEKLTRQSGRTLSVVAREAEERNRLFTSLSDPKGQSLNVRINEIKGGLKFGPRDGKREDKKAEDGIFDWLFKGFTGLFRGLGRTVTTLATGVTGFLTTMGAVLGGGAITGAIGLASSVGAATASLYTLKESIETTIYLRDAEAQSLREKMRFAKAHQKSLNDITNETEKKAQTITKKINDLEAERIQLEILRKNTKEDVEAGLSVQGVKGILGSALGIKKSFGREEAERYKRIQKEIAEMKLRQAENTKEISTAIVKETEKKQKPSDILIEIEKIKRSSNSTVGMDPVVTELSAFRKDIQTLLKGYTNQSQLNRATDNTLLLAAQGIDTPLAAPDNFLAQPPSAPQQTGVISP